METSVGTKKALGKQFEAIRCRMIVQNTFKHWTEKLSLHFKKQLAKCMLFVVKVVTFNNYTVYTTQ